jgi:FkbM family methyltransferase
MRSLLTRTAYAALRAGIRLPGGSLLQGFLERGRRIDLLHNLRIDCVLDVGANKGLFGRHVRMMGYKGPILCFEPLRADCDLISRLARRDPLWRVFNFALGSENVVRPFNVMSLPAVGTMLSSFLQPKTNVVYNSLAEVAGGALVPLLPSEKDLVQTTEPVTMRRLDDVLDEVIQDYPAIARIFLKMDTQGYDLEVLKGCTKWLDKVCLLQSEISVSPLYEDMPHYTRALDHYDSLGFSLMDLEVVNRARDGHIVEYDCLMARLDRFS